MVRVLLRINDGSVTVQYVNKTNPLVVATKEIGLAVNSETIKYMLMSRHHSSRQNHNIKIDNKFSERVEQFKYLGTTPTNQNCIHEEIKSRLKSEIACYHSVQNLLTYILSTKKHKD